MFKKLFSKPLEAAKDKVSEYVNLKMEEVKLSTIEKASPIAASALIVGIILTLSMITFVFLGMGIASWFTKLLDNAIAGYFATAGIFIIFLIILALAFKPIVRFIANKIGKGLSDTL